MSDLPLVSAIIPFYERLSLTRRAIISVIDQTYPNIEILIVDDCSTNQDPGLDEILAASNHKIFRLQRNSGPAIARNYAASRASGQYLAFLDSDDYWLPEKIAQQVRWHQFNPKIKISQCREVWFRNGQRVNQSQRYAPDAGDLFIQSLDACVISPSSVFLETALFHKYHGFPEELFVCEDYALWLLITSQNLVGIQDEQLTVKFAGHVDQLSKRFPAMDRFRVWALYNLYLKYDLNSQQQALVIQELNKKISILLAGAKKNNLDFQIYEDLLVNIDKPSQILLNRLLSN